MNENKIVTKKLGRHGFIKTVPSMNIKTEDYEIIEGILTWINPELKEFTVPDGVVTVWLNRNIKNFLYDLDFSEKERRKVPQMPTREAVENDNLESITFSSSVRDVWGPSFANFKNLKNSNTVLDSRTKIRDEFKVDTVILPHCFYETLGGKFLAKKVFVSYDQDHYSNFSINWHYMVDRNYVEELSCPIYMLNNEEFSNCTTINYYGSLKNKIVKDEVTVCSEENKFPSLEVVNIIEDTDNDLIDDVLEGDMLRVLENRIVAFVDRNKKIFSIKEIDAKYAENKKISEEHYRKIKLNFEVKSRDNSFANDLNTIFNSCGDINCFFALMKYISTYVVNNNLENSKRKIISKVAENLKNKKDTSTCLYNLLATIKMIFLDENWIYCVDKSNVIFADIIEEYDKLKKFATYYKTLILAPSSKLIGNQFGHCKLLNDFIFEDKESSDVLKELLAELERIYNILYDDIVCAQTAIVNTKFACVKILLNK